MKSSELQNLHELVDKLQSKSFMADFKAERALMEVRIPYKTVKTRSEAVKVGY